MRWIKRGLIFAADGRYPWMSSHSQSPLVDPVDETRLRIYFGTRDAANHTRPAFIDVSATDPQKVLDAGIQPVLDLGALGCFDDSGVMPSWIVRHDGRKHLYYIGLNTGGTVPYRNSIGLAVTEEEGSTFHRAFPGPVLDRVAEEPQLCTSPCVVIEDGVWKMWYTAGVKWELFNGRPEPLYNIRYTESADGIHWQRPGRVAIELNAGEGGLARPSVIHGPDLYRMWFSYRGPSDYRTNRAHSYRIGYAESADGVVWARNDAAGGLDVSGNGWDSEMAAYPYIFEHQGCLHMLYNGNGFGRSGFGYAVAEG